MKVGKLQCDVAPWDFMRVRNPEEPSKLLPCVVVVPAWSDAYGNILFGKLPQIGVVALDESLLMGLSEPPTAMALVDRPSMLNMAVETLQEEELDVWTLPKDFVPVKEKEDWQAVVEAECDALDLPSWCKLSPVPFSCRWEVGNLVYRWNEDNKEVRAVVAAVLADATIACLPKRCKKIQYWDMKIISGILA